LFTWLHENFRILENTDEKHFQHGQYFESKTKLRSGTTTQLAQLCSICTHKEHAENNAFHFNREYKMARQFNVYQMPNMSGESRDWTELG